MRCIMRARTHMEKLDKCIMGKKILDRECQTISEILMSGHVPGTWTVYGGKVLQEDGATTKGKTMPIEAFLELVQRRVGFCEVMAYQW